MPKPAKNGLDQCGQVLRELREQHGLSQVDLARKMNGLFGCWTNIRLCKIESDKLPVTRKTIHQFASALEMRPERLYLMCLMAQYPALAEGELGILLDKIVNSSQVDDGDDEVSGVPVPTGTSENHR